MKAVAVPVGVLAGVEGRRLLRHPATGLGLVIATLLIVVAERDAGDEVLRYKQLVGAGFLPAATACLLASWAAVTCSRRDGSEDLLASMPTEAGTRGAAHLVAVAAPTGAAIVVVAAVAAAVDTWSGPLTPVVAAELVDAGVEPVTTPFAGLLQGPVLVACAGIVGVALGRSAAPSATVVVAALLGLYLHLPAVLWWEWSWQRFLLPAAHDLEPATVHLPDAASDLKVGGESRPRWRQSRSPVALPGPPNATPLRS